MRTSSEGSDDLSSVIRPNLLSREEKLTYRKTAKGIDQVRVFVKVVFGYADQHGNATLGLRFKLALQK